MFKKIASTFSTKVITSLVNLLIVVIISRTMGPEGKGEASLIVTSIAMVMMLCNVIGGATLVYLVPRHNFFQLFVLSWAWSTLICGLGFLVVRFAGQGIYITVLRLYAGDIFLLSLLSSFMSVNLMLLLGKERIMANNLVSLQQSLLNFGLLAALVYGMNERNIVSYIQTLYVSFGACTLVSLFFITKHFTAYSMAGFSALVKESFRLGTANQAGHVMQFLSLRLSFYLLETISGSGAVGIYSNGVSIVESIWLITNSIAVVQYASIANSSDKAYAQQLTLQLTRFSTLICIAALVVMLLLPSSFFVWLFGNGFAGVNRVILVLAPGVFFYNTGLIIGHYFSGTGNYHVNTAGNFLGLLVTAGGSFLYLDRYNGDIAGIISSISYAVMSVYVLVYFMNESRAKISDLIPKAGDIRAVFR